MGRAAPRSRPDTPGDDLDTRLAALAGRAEKLLARWEQESPCGDAVLAGVELSEQLARAAVAYEDDAADEFAVTTAFAAGIAEGERRAAARQQPRERSQDGAPVIRLIPGGLSERPRRVSAARIVAAAGAVAAGTASTAPVFPLPD